MFRYFPSFCIYSVENFKSLNEENLIEYFKENIKISNVNNKTNIELPEHFCLIEPQFMKNLPDYKK